MELVQFHKALNAGQGTQHNGFRVRLELRCLTYGSQWRQEPPFGQRAHREIHIIVADAFGSLATETKEKLTSIETPEADAATERDIVHGLQDNQLKSRWHPQVTQRITPTVTGSNSHRNEGSLQIWRLCRRCSLPRRPAREGCYKNTTMRVGTGIFQCRHSVRFDPSAKLRQRRYSGQDACATSLYLALSLSPTPLPLCSFACSAKGTEGFGMRRFGGLGLAAGHNRDRL